MERSTKVGRFLRWSRPERRAYLQALALSWAVKGGLTFLPFRTVRGLLERLATRGVSSQGEDDETATERIVWAVRTANRRVPGTTCLVRAMTTQVLLRRRGIPASLRIGVAKDDVGGFRAHAWLESGGRVLIGGSDPLLSRYEVLAAREERRALDRNVPDADVGKPRG